MKESGNVEFDEKDPNSNEQIEGNKNINNDKKTEAEEENIKVEQKINFDYLISSDAESTPFSFPFEENNINNCIYQDVGEFKYAICILLKDNSYDNCKLLKHTLEKIVKNLKKLESFDIKANDVYIFVFVKHVFEEFLIKKDSIKLMSRKLNYLKTPVKIKDETEDFKIDIICKNKYMSDVESLKIFYNYCVGNLKKKENVIITSVITAGVILDDDCLLKLIQLSYIKTKRSNKNEKIFGISVPSLEVKDDNGLLIKIAQYERLHFNIYSLGFYCQTAVVPISSLLNTMIIDNILMKDLMAYYKSIPINATIDYHDYNLALYLFRLLYKITYYCSETLGKIEYNNFNYINYKDNWVNKFSGYYGNFFEIGRTFITCKDFFSKIFMFFQIIGLMIEFIYPSLSILVIYTIFYEAFNINDKLPAIFMVLLYLIIYLGSGACSMISMQSETIEFVNYFFYIFMEVYYLFILACSIPAMDNIKKQKTSFGFEDEYKFNKNAIICLIIFTFIIGILPIFVKMATISKNCAQMLIYLLFAAPSSTSNFLIAKIWRAPETMGGEWPEDRKGVIVIMFFLFNLFFGFLSFLNNDRKKRVNCVMILSIIYLIYLFFKVVAILFPLICGAQINKKNDEKIKGAINKLYKNKNDLSKSTEKLKEEINEEKLDESEKDNKENESQKEKNEEKFEIENNEENNNEDNDKEKEGNEGNESS